MKADVQYNDFVGTAAADISDFLGSEFSDSLESFAKYFKLDTNRFKVIGISIYGTDNHYISLLCVDNRKSTADKEHIVSMSVDIKEDEEFLPFLFKRLHIVLHSRLTTNIQILSIMKKQTMMTITTLTKMHNYSQRRLLPHRDLTNKTRPYIFN